MATLIEPPRLIVARHGQTEWNREAIIMGRQDSPLTAEGIKEAEDLAAQLAGHFSRLPGAIVASPLGRARATAEIHAAALGWPIHPADGLAELSCGFLEGRFKTEAAHGGINLRRTWTERPGNGEGYADAEPRVRKVIELIESLRPGPVLSVGHSVVNRVLLKLWLDLPAEEAVDLYCPHGAAFLIAPDRRVIRLEADGTLGGC